MADRAVAAKIVPLRNNYAGIACTHSGVRTGSDSALMFALLLEASTNPSVTIRGDHNW